jgi:hypothetical protein
MYTEEIGYQMEVLENGIIQVRRNTHILKDGVEISVQYHRHVLEPGQETIDQVQRVKDVAAVVWTPKVIAKYKEEKDKIKAELGIG